MGQTQQRDHLLEPLYKLLLIEAQLLSGTLDSQTHLRTEMLRQLRVVVTG